eukprot:jgi/Chrpa1/10274/Chrysochromulina_OHIO_Genome00015344-RA
MKTRKLSKRSWWRAAFELIVTGEWLNAHVRYDDYPNPDVDDLLIFKESMTNIGLLAALMFTVICEMLFNYASAATALSVVVSLCILAVMLLYFISCTWWDGNREISDTTTEGSELLSWIWVAGAWVEVAMTASLLIFQVARNIQFVYECKLDAKMRNASLMSVGKAGEKRALAEYTTRFEIVVGADQMIADLQAFIQHVGAEHVDLDRLMRYLFHRHRPRALEGALEDAEQKLDVRFAPNTRARAERFLDQVLEARLNHELAAHKQALMALGSSWQPPVTDRLTVEDDNAS